MSHQILVTVNGVSKTPQEWADYLGISVTSFFMRLEDGRNVDDKLFGSTSVSSTGTVVPKVENVIRNGRKAYLLTLKGETKTLKEWCSEIGIGLTSLRYRLEKGFTEDQILQPRQATNRKDLPILNKGEKPAVEKKPKSKKKANPSSATGKKEKAVKPAKESVAKKEQPVKTVKLLNTELPIADWAKTIGISVDVLEYRINQGWSEQEILYGKKSTVTAPTVTKNPNKVVSVPDSERDSKLDQIVCYEGDMKTLREWSVELGISQSVIRNRMAQGKKGRELLRPVRDVEARVDVRIGQRTLSFRQWAERSGVPEHIIRDRYNKGIRGEQLIFLDPKYQKKQA